MPGDSLLDHALWNASAAQFEQQLRWIKARAEIIPLLEMPAALSKGRGRFVAITFDDGYQDNFATAFPILRDLGVTATFFVSTGFIDSPRSPWWDEIAWVLRTSRAATLEVPGLLDPVTLDPSRRKAIRRVLQHAKQIENGDIESFIETLAATAGTGRIPAELAPKWVTWSELIEMQEVGMEIGGHTVNHPVLGRLDTRAQLHELDESHARISTVCGTRPRAMSYPVGGVRAYDENTKRAAASAGWQMACNYRGGSLSGSVPDLFDVPRIAMQPYTRLADLAAAFTWPDRFAIP